MPKKVILVTGASRGLGYAIATECLQMGAQVLGVGRSCPRAVDKLREQFPDDFHYYQCDLGSFENCEMAVQECTLRFKTITGLVLNAGVLGPLASVAEASIPEWQQTFNVNFFGGISCIQAALPALRRERGAIVIVSSGAAVSAKQGWAAYCTSKAAVNMLASCLGQEEPDVTTVAVRPGIVDTEMQTDIRERGSQAMDAKLYNKLVAMKKNGALLDAKIPGRAIAQLVIHPSFQQSGQFLDHTDVKLQA